MRKSLISLLLLLLAATSARAQFYLPGNDPGRLRWYSLETPHYQFLYPEGADSLARSYARLWEQFREPLGRSIGHTPGQRRMPIVLHTHNLYSNGSVGWAPTRMDLYTVPDAYGSDPLPWAVQLAAHEPRHQAQLEKLESHGLFKGLHYVIGQGWAPIAWTLYLSETRGEGDAVAVETGLTYGSRARTADFLQYMRVAFDQGDWRSAVRWHKGSYKKYTPDYYKVGYLTMAGSRYLYGQPLLTDQSLLIPEKKPWLFASLNFNKYLKQQDSSFVTKRYFRQIEESFNAIWQADAATREPFMPLKQVTKAEAYPLEFASPQWIDGSLYAIRSGYLRTHQLVRITEGKLQAVQPFGSHTSSLFYDPSWRRIYWSETLPDPRWELAGTSVIRYLDLLTQKTATLTRGTRYYNPQPSPDGSTLAVVEYAVDGGCYSVILSAQDGSVLQRNPGPQGVQLTESAWLDGFLYCLGLSLDGYGLYRWQGAWEPVLSPSHQKVVNLGAGDGVLEWVSDRTGVNELYRYNPNTGVLEQLTCSRYGATDYCSDGENLFSVSQTLDGRLIFCTPLDSLQPRQVAFANVHAYPIEDTLTAQEQALGPGPNLSQEVALSAPRRYSKLANPLRLHSWLPFYANADAIMNGSFDFTYQTVAAGVVGFFQNTLGTLSGQAGYSIHPDPDKLGPWRSALHAKISYTGQYPVLEAQVDWGDSRAKQYTLAEYYRGSRMVARGSLASYREAPLLSASLRAYIPLAYRKGGILFGFTPQLKYTFTNNVYSRGSIRYNRFSGTEGLPNWNMLREITPADNVYMQRVSASLRGYMMLPRAHSQIYPRWGLGLEGGLSFRPQISQIYRPVAYAYAYAYTPGLFRTQGMKLTAMLQKQLDQGIFGNQYVDILPRGFESSAGSYLASNARSQWRVTADYALPFYAGDLSIPYVGYFRRFILTPHADYLGFGTNNLWSAGADFVADMGSLFIFTMDIKLGVSFSCLGGTAYEKTGQSKPYSVSLVFNMDI